MDRKQVKEILQKYNSGLATAEQKALLDNWYMQKSESLTLEDGEIDFDTIDSDLRSRTFRYVGIAEQNPLAHRKPFKLWIGISAAASIIAVISSILFFYSKTPVPLSHTKNVSAIVPGTDKAILTLANGKKIELNETASGALASEGDALIRKMGDGQVVYERIDKDRGTPLFNTITTPRGGQYRLRLADGTKVILNAGSSLKYPTIFGGGNRTVELTGEGYFEVARDKEHPFIVVSGGQKVEVLGTHFNINSYKEEGAIKTTLLEGAVRLSLSRTTGGSLKDHSNILNEVVLKPNQEASLSNHRFTVGQADPAATAWLNGKFQFNNTPLSEVMRQISRWYDIDVVYPDGIPDESLTGGINRNLSASELLGMLERMHVKAKLVGKKIIINK